MKSIVRIFNTKSTQKAFLAGAIAVGSLGLLGGAWLAASGEPSSVAGLVGGAVTFAIGYAGLRQLQSVGPT